MAKKFYSNEGMLSGKGGNAGLPSETVIKSYDSVSKSLNITVKDGVAEYDKQQSEDLNGIKKQLSKTPY